MKKEQIKELEHIKKLDGLPLNYQLMTIKIIRLSELPNSKYSKISFYQSDEVSLKNIGKPISKLFELNGAK